MLHSRVVGIVLVRSTSPHAGDDSSSKPFRDAQPAALFARRSDGSLKSRGIQTSSSLDSAAAAAAAAASSSPFDALPVTSRAAGKARTAGNSGKRCVSSHVLRSRAGVSSARSARRQFRLVADASALLDVCHCPTRWCCLLSFSR